MQISFHFKLFLCCVSIDGLCIYIALLALQCKYETLIKINSSHHALMTLIRLMCAGTIICWSDLHRNGFEWVVPALPSLPKDIYLFKPNGTVRGVNAVGVHHVAGVVPESTKVIVSTVFVPLVLIFVKCCELHVVVSSQTVPWRKKKRSMIPAEVKDQIWRDIFATDRLKSYTREMHLQTKGELVYTSILCVKQKVSPGFAFGQFNLIWWKFARKPPVTDGNLKNLAF